MLYGLNKTTHFKSESGFASHLEMEIHGPLTDKKLYCLHLKWRESPHLSSMIAWKDTGEHSTSLW